MPTECTGTGGANICAKPSAPASSPAATGATGSNNPAGQAGWDLQPAPQEIDRKQHDKPDQRRNRVDAIRHPSAIPGNHPGTPTTKRSGTGPNHPPTGPALRQPPTQPASNRNADARRGPNGDPHRKTSLNANGVRKAEPRKRQPARRNRSFSGVRPTSCAGRCSIRKEEFWSEFISFTPWNQAARKKASRNKNSKRDGKKPPTRPNRPASITDRQPTK